MDIAVKNRNRHRQERRSSVRSGLMSAVIGAALIGIGLAAGFALSREGVATLTPSIDLPLEPQHDWIDNLCATARVFGKKYQPMIDVGPDNESAVTSLVSNTTGLQIAVPSFDAFGQIFEGARIVTVGRIPGAELFYRNSAGDLISVFVLAQSKSDENQITEVNETIRDNLTVAWWQGQNALYAVVGPSSDANLPDLAKAAYLDF